MTNGIIFSCKIAANKVSVLAVETFSAMAYDYFCKILNVVSGNNAIIMNIIQFSLK